MKIEYWHPGSSATPTQSMAIEALHKLWTETEYPEKSKRLWQLVLTFIEAQLKPISASITLPRDSGYSQLRGAREVGGEVRIEGSNDGGKTWAEIKQ